MQLLLMQLLLMQLLLMQLLLMQLLLIQLLLMQLLLMQLLLMQLLLMQLLLMQLLLMQLLLMLQVRPQLFSNTPAAAAFLVLLRKELHCHLLLRIQLPQCQQQTSWGRLQAPCYSSKGGMVNGCRRQLACLSCQLLHCC
jgi:hypothetical protein